ncbi:MAG: hypothetical protein R3B89_16855 [Polyangiaceae bacterium]
MLQRSGPWLLCVFALCQCKEGAEPAPTASAASSVAASATSASLAPLGSVDWGRASGDPLDLAALGREIGAKRCVDEVISGGEHGGEALQVLPYTPDAEAQLGPLCESLSRASAEQRSARLASIASALAQPGSGREVLDVSGLRRCAAVLRAAQPGAAGRDRDHIDSALEQLGARRVETR